MTNALFGSLPSMKLTYLKMMRSDGRWVGGNMTTFWAWPRPWGSNSMRVAASYSRLTFCVSTPSTGSTITITNDRACSLQWMHCSAVFRQRNKPPWRWWTKRRIINICSVELRIRKPFLTLSRPYGGQIKRVSGCHVSFPLNFLCFETGSLHPSTRGPLSRPLRKALFLWGCDEGRGRRWLLHPVNGL